MSLTASKLNKMISNENNLATTTALYLSSSGVFTRLLTNLLLFRQDVVGLAHLHHAHQDTNFNNIDSPPVLDDLAQTLLDHF